LSDGVSEEALLSAIAAGFDRAYSSQRSYFGTAPSSWLVRFLGHPADRGRRALDMGCGHGRNALYLASLGYTVTAVDVSEAAVRELESCADAEGLPVRAVRADLQDCELGENAYDVIVAVTVLGLIERSVLAPLAARMERALRPGGLLLVEDFAEADPGFSGRPRPSEFAHLAQHYFTSAALLRLFRPLDVISCHEFALTDATHGRPHRHGLVRYAARRPPVTAAGG